MPVFPEKHIYAFLWFVGHQVSNYRKVDDRFDITLSGLYKVITRASNFLGDLAPEFIK